MTSGQRVRRSVGLAVGFTLSLVVVSTFLPLNQLGSAVDAFLMALLFPGLALARIFGYLDRLPSNEGCFTICVGSVLFYSALAWFLLGLPWRRSRRTANQRPS
jgi:hypothetical protein